ncbi:MAG: hypothetical protein AAF968_01865 [Pseudomonadota bacterium]
MSDIEGLRRSVSALAQKVDGRIAPGDERDPPLAEVGGKQRGDVAVRHEEIVTHRERGAAIRHVGVADHFHSADGGYRRLYRLSWLRVIEVEPIGVAGLKSSPNDIDRGASIGNDDCFQEKLFSGREVLFERDLFHDSARARRAEGRRLRGLRTGYFSDCLLHFA